MAWIKIIEKKDAFDQLAYIYKDIEKKRGKLSNILKVHSLNPDVMKKHMDLYLSIMFKNSGLSREQREMIAVVVSYKNNCEYCVNHHKKALNYYWKNNKKIQKLLNDPILLSLSKKDEMMLSYVIKLTKNPSSIEKKDIDILRNSGFNDEDILNINLITSYFNFVNRIALGLGVKFSDEEISGYKY